MYTIPIILVLISYFLGTYLAEQGLRSPVERPVIYKNEPSLIFLAIIFGWSPIVIALYLGFRDEGVIFALVLAFFRFVILPTILNNKIRSLIRGSGF